MCENCSILYSQAIKSAIVKTYHNSKVLSCKSSSLVPANTSARFVADEKIDCIRKARQSWEQGINEELLAIATEAKRLFVTTRYSFLLVILGVCICLFRFIISIYARRCV